MFKNVFVASLTGLTLASSSPASVMTYVLSLNDNGAGVRTLGSYAVYAYTSAGDNSGMASFNFTLTGQATTVNRSPQATFNDNAGEGDTKRSGFTLLRSNGSSGVATTGAFDTVSGNGLLVYGLGQTGPGNVRDVPVPAGYSPSSTIAQGAYGVTNSFTATNAQGVATSTGGQVPVLLGSGTYTNPLTLTYGLAAVFTNQTGSTALPTTTTSVTRDLNVFAIATLTASDAAGTSSFASGLNWSNGTAPTSSSAYSVGSGLTLRTASGGGNATFGGASLTVGDNGASVGNLVLENANGSTVTVNNLTLNKGTITNGGSNNTAATSVTVAGSGITLAAGGGTLDSGAAGRTLTVSSVIGGSGPLTIAGGGTVVLTTSTTHTGATGITAGAVLELSPVSAADYGPTTFTGGGTLRKAGASTSFWGAGTTTFALGSGSVIDVQGGELTGGNNAIEVWTNNKSDLNVAVGATYNGSRANVRVDALTGGGTVRTGIVGSGYTTFTLGVDNGSGTFAGIIADTLGAATPGKLTKEGTGTQTLVGTNTYTGGTVVSGGTLSLGDGGTGGKLATSGTITIGNGANLTINRSDAVIQGTDFGASPISGAGGFTKAGTGILTLTVANTYTGLTTVAAGTLRAASAAAVQPLLTTTSGVDLAGGAKLELEYTGTSPAATVKSILTNGYSQSSKFNTGQLRSSTLANGRTIGYGDNGSTVTVRVTLPGDANLNGAVDFDDFAVLQTRFGQSVVTFAQGDFNYSDSVDFNDFALLQTNFGQSLPGARAVYTREQYVAIMSITDASQVPEPASLAMLAAGGLMLTRRRGRRASSLGTGMFDALE